MSGCSIPPKRFGTSIPEMGGKTGTEHEIRTAIAASRKSGKPDVVIFFNEAPYRSKTAEECKQATQVLEFREQIQGMELATKARTIFVTRFATALKSI